MVVGEIGFEPMKTLHQQIYSLSQLAALVFPLQYNIIKNFVFNISNCASFLKNEVQN